MDPDVSQKLKIKDKSKAAIRKMNSENLLKNIWQVTYNSFLAAVLNLTFHLVLSRKLGPASYGELQTLITINNIIIIALAAVSFVMTRFISYYRTREKYDKMKFLAQWAFIFFFFLGMASFVITVMISNVSSEFLNIADHNIIIIFGFLIWISFLIPIVEGILRGLQEFKHMSHYKILEAFLRMAISIILVFLGFQLKSIIAGLVFASIITVVFSAYLLKKNYITKPHKIHLKEIYLFLVPVFLTCILYAIISNIDIILVKHFFSPDEAGYFAAASMLAKITIGLAFGSAGVMFPKIVEDVSNGNERDARVTLKNTLKITMIASCSLSILMALFPNFTSHLFFGDAYNIGNMLSVYVLATMFLSIVTVLMMYDLAVKRYNFIIMFFISSLVMIYQIYILHATLMNVAWTLFVVDFVLLLFMVVYNRKILFG